MSDPAEQFIKELLSRGWKGSDLRPEIAFTGVEGMVEVAVDPPSASISARTLPSPSRLAFSFSGDLDSSRYSELLQLVTRCEEDLSRDGLLRLKKSWLGFCKADLKVDWDLPASEVAPYSTLLEHGWQEEMPNVLGGSAQSFRLDTPRSRLSVSKSKYGPYLGFRLTLLPLPDSGRVIGGELEMRFTPASLPHILASIVELQESIGSETWHGVLAELMRQHRGKLVSYPDSLTKQKIEVLSKEGKSPSRPIETPTVSSLTMESFPANNQRAADWAEIREALEPAGWLNPSARLDADPNVEISGFGHGVLDYHHAGIRLSLEGHVNRGALRLHILQNESGLTLVLRYGKNLARVVTELRSMQDRINAKNFREHVAGLLAVCPDIFVETEEGLVRLRDSSKKAGSESKKKRTKPQQVATRKRAPK